MNSINPIVAILLAILFGSFSIAATAACDKFLLRKKIKRPISIHFWIALGISTLGPALYVHGAPVENFVVTLEATTGLAAVVYMGTIVGNVPYWIPICVLIVIVTDAMLIGQFHVATDAILASVPFSLTSLLVRKRRTFYNEAVLSAIAGALLGFAPACAIIFLSSVIAVPFGLRDGGESDDVAFVPWIAGGVLASSVVLCFIS